MRNDLQDVEFGILDGLSRFSRRHFHPELDPHYRNFRISKSVIDRTALRAFNLNSDVADFLSADQKIYAVIVFSLELIDAALRFKFK